MSKAFTKETEPEDDLPEELPRALPEGVKNYMTPEGFRRMQDKLRRDSRAPPASHMSRPASNR